MFTTTAAGTHQSTSAEQHKMAESAAASVSELDVKSVEGVAVYSVRRGVLLPSRFRL